MTVTRRICLLGTVAALCAPISVWAQAEPLPHAFVPGTLPATIPIFPLEDVMLFPHASRSLHIFEQAAHPVGPASVTGPVWSEGPSHVVAYVRAGSDQAR